MTQHWWKPTQPINSCMEMPTETLELTCARKAAPKLWISQLQESHETASPFADPIQRAADRHSGSEGQGVCITLLGLQHSPSSASRASQGDVGWQSGKALGCIVLCPWSGVHWAARGDSHQCSHETAWALVPPVLASFSPHSIPTASSGLIPNPPCAEDPRFAGSPEGGVSGGQGAMYYMGRKGSSSPLHLH